MNKENRLVLKKPSLDEKFDKALEVLGVSDTVVTEVIDPAQFNAGGTENLWLPKTE